MVATSILTTTNCQVFSSDTSKISSSNLPAPNVYQPQQAPSLTFAYIESKLAANVGGDLLEIRGIVSKTLEYIKEKKVISISSISIFGPPA